MVHTWFFCLEGIYRIQATPFVNASAPFAVVLSKRPYRDGLRSDARFVLSLFKKDFSLPFRKVR